MTNSSAAAQLQVSASTVSRLRAGLRRPSFDLMLRIRREFGWSLDEQAEALTFGSYGHELDIILDISQ